MSASITISRDSGWADRLRAYRIELDGVKLGTIDNGESKTFFIEPGSYQLVLKIDWCGSNTVAFNLPADGKALFECGSNLRGAALLLFFFYVLFARDQYLWLRPAAE